MFDKTDTILFLDHEAIAQTVRLSRVWEQPNKFGAVLVPDRVWEHQCVVVYGSVLPNPDGGGYQMWYQNFATHVRGPERAVFCYATSADGVHWEKPSLGLVSYRGSQDNNIVLMAEKMWLSTLTVVLDPREAEERRYKMLYSCNEEGPGLYAAFSPDGIHWTVRPRPVCTSASDRTTMLFDPAREAPFVAFTRAQGEAMRRDFHGRIIYRTESPDMLTWSALEPTLWPDLDDPWDVQFYGMPAWRYRDLYLGGLKRLWTTPDRIDTELVTSRDTRTWRRSRASFLPNGEGEAWDRKWVALASSPPIEREGQLWFYHEARKQAHGQRYPFPQGAICLATLPKDRFCALEAGPTEGLVRTKPFLWEGGKLCLNGKVHNSGGIRVEVLDEAGAPIAGFTRDDAATMHGDSPAWEPAWGREATLDALRGRTIALCLHLANARLYALSRT